MIIVLAGAILPFIIWSIEVLFPYPFIVEELAKTALVLWILKTQKSPIRITIIVGFIFAFSESVLYITNFLLVGTIWTFFGKIMLTVLLHTTTMLIILLLTMRKGKLLILGVIAAMLIHYLFNLLVTGL